MLDRFSSSPRDRVAGSPSLVSEGIFDLHPIHPRRPVSPGHEAKGIVGVKLPDWIGLVGEVRDERGQVDRALKYASPVESRIHERIARHVGIDRLIGLRDGLRTLIR